VSELRPPYAFPEEVIRDLDGRELWRGTGPLSRADLRGADLRRADLRSRRLFGGRLRGADLRGASLDGAGLVLVDLTGADLRTASLALDHCHGVSLRRADLRDVRGWILDGGGAGTTWDAPLDLCGADLRDATLTGLDERDFVIVDGATQLGKLAIPRAVDESLWLERASDGGWSSSPSSVLRDRIGRPALIGPEDRIDRLTERFDWGIDLSGCDFTRVDQSHLFSLGSCTLDGSDFSGVDLYSSMWMDVSARACDFSGADLRATRHDCDFRDAWFVGADLGYNGMGGRERWYDCDLRGARFAGANLCGTDLFSCRGEGTDLSGAYFDARTRFPRDVKRPPRGAYERPLPWFERDDPRR